MKLERLAISCGGTGGHFYPGLAVARKFKENGGRVLLVIGGKNAPAQSKIADSYGIENIQIAASPPSLRPMGFLIMIVLWFFGVTQSHFSSRKFFKVSYITFFFKNFTP